MKIRYFPLADKTSCISMYISNQSWEKVVQLQNKTQVAMAQGNKDRRRNTCNNIVLSFQGVFVERMTLLMFRGGEPCDIVVCQIRRRVTCFSGSDVDGALMQLYSACLIHPDRFRKLAFLRIWHTTVSHGFSVFVYKQRHFFNGH